MNQHHTEAVKVTDKVESTIKRGNESWAYIYIALGFLLSFEGTFIQFIEPLKWPYSLLTYIVVFTGTCWAFLFNGRVQNWLIGLKMKYENVAH